MKPRIRLYRMVWDCRLPDWLATGVIGFGYGPKEAYDDWRRQALWRSRKGLA
jgi:hypothetical protein